MQNIDICHCYIEKWECVPKYATLLVACLRLSFGAIAEHAVGTSNQPSSARILCSLSFSSFTMVQSYPARLRPLVVDSFRKRLTIFALFESVHGPTMHSQILTHGPPRLLAAAWGVLDNIDVDTHLLKFSIGILDS